MSATYAARLSGIPIPSRIRALPVHPEMRLPLPWFCQQEPPDFRVARGGALAQAHRRQLCWICGQPRYPKRMAFVVGAMCIVTGTASEPPSHPECARFAAQACPFLANPRMRRNEQGLRASDGTLLGGLQESAGHSIQRNPGVAAILTTDHYKLFGDGRGGVLVEMGKPLRVDWWREGRAATRDEVAHSIDTGLPTLERIANDEGPEAAEALAQQRRKAEAWMPAA